MVDAPRRSPFRRPHSPAGLRAPVAVRFDRFAIPHISATSDEDAWQTVGLLQARDRLWQMELYRRVASGRLSELLGERHASRSIAGSLRLVFAGRRKSNGSEPTRRYEQCLKVTHAA